MTLSSLSVDHLMLAGVQSRPDGSYNDRRRLIETIAFATAHSTVEAALMLFWLERIIVSARLRDYHVIFPREVELDSAYLLFAKIFQANDTGTTSLKEHIAHYLLDPEKYESTIQHTRLGPRLVYGQVAVTIRRKLPSALIPAFSSPRTHPHTGM